LNIGNGVLEINDFLITLLGGFAPGDYMLFDGNTPIIGTLGPNVTGTLAPGFTGTLQIASDTTDLFVRVTPEPCSASLMFGGIGLLVGSKRNRRSARL
jgi:hypothetical protein